MQTKRLRLRGKEKGCRGGEVPSLQEDEALGEADSKTHPLPRHPPHDGHVDAQGRGSLATVQRVLRHTDPAITSEVYGHLDMDDMRKGVNALAFQISDKTKNEVLAMGEPTSRITPASPTFVADFPGIDAL
jgi:hypothetical protein